MSRRLDHHALNPRGLAQHGGLVNRAALHFNPRGDAHGGPMRLNLLACHALNPRGGLVNRAAHHFNPRVLAQTEAP